MNTFIGVSLAIIAVAILAIMGVIEADAYSYDSYIRVWSAGYGGV